jgi:WD40 repeat protein
MYRSAAILFLLSASSDVMAEGSEPSPPPATSPLKIETPNEKPTEQIGLSPGALLQIGSAHSPRMLEGQFAFSPDGKFIAAGTAAHFVRVWDATTGKIVHNFGPFGQHSVSWRIIDTVVFAPDGNALAIASEGKVKLFELKTGKEVGEIQGPTSFIGDIAFSANGKTLATGYFDHSQTSSFNQTAAIWDRATFKPLCSLTGFAAGARRVAYSDDSATLAAADSKGLVRLWRVSDGAALRDLTGLKSAAGFLRFADNGKTLLACGEEEGLISWDVATGATKRRIAEMKGIAVLSPDGSQIAIVQGYDPVVVWDVKSGKPIVKIKGNQGGVFTVSFAADNRMLATYGGDGMLRYWKLPGGEEVNPPLGHQNRITGVGFTRDGKQLISASEDCTVRFWDAETGKELKRLSAANEHFNALALSPDSKTLVLVGGGLPHRWRWGLDEAKQSSSLRFFAIDSGREVRSFHIAGETGGALRFTADGRELLVVGHSGVRLVDSASGRSRDPGIHAEQGLPAADVAPDGRYIALSTNVPALRQIGKIAYIDTKDNKEVFSETFYLGGYSSLAFTPDGRHLAVASSSGLQLWEVPTEKVVRDFDRNNSHIDSLVFSRDGRMLAAASTYDGIEVFEVATGKRRYEFAGHEGGIGALAFSRDGQRLVSGGIDGRVIVWDLTGTMGKSIAKLDEKELDGLWNDLASENAATANEAIGKMAARPLESARYLRQRMPVLSDADLKRIEPLIVDLDSNQFRVRERATRELEKIGQAAAPGLTDALSSSSAEVRQTAERLLQKIGDGEDPVTSPEARRAVRAIEILERIGKADAIALLKNLRQRGNKLVVHREAVAALGRIEIR